METSKLEDFLSENMGLNDMTVALAVGSYLGGQAILENRRFVSLAQEVKADGSTVGKLDNVSGQRIARYFNSNPLSDSVRFNSEEKMPFDVPTVWTHAGIFDDLDGSINPMIGGANLNYIGVGGVIHERELNLQVSTAAYLPFLARDELYVAQKYGGTYRVNLSEEGLS